MGPSWLLLCSEHLGLLALLEGGGCGGFHRGAGGYHEALTGHVRHGMVSLGCGVALRVHCDHIARGQCLTGHEPLSLGVVQGGWNAVAAIAGIAPIAADNWCCSRCRGCHDGSTCSGDGAVGRHSPSGHDGCCGASRESHDGCCGASRDGHDGSSGLSHGA